MLERIRRLELESEQIKRNEELKSLREELERVKEIRELKMQHYRENYAGYESELISFHDEKEAAEQSIVKTNVDIVNIVKKIEKILKEEANE
jgi:hypothetical protein